jgi:hypothetical protein
MEKVEVNSISECYDPMHASIPPWSFNSWNEYSSWLDKGLDLGLIEYVIIRKNLFRINDKGLKINSIRYQ